MFCLTALRHDLIKKFNDLPVHLMRFVNRLDHRIFWHLFGTGLDHDHLFPRRSNRKRQIRNKSLLKCRVYDKLTIDKTDLRRSCRAVERNV